MTKILIIEGDTPELVEAAILRGETGLAEHFGAALRRLDGDLKILTHQPYSGGLPNLSGVDGVVFTGSGVPWCVDEAPGRAQADTMRAALDSGLPVFGACNGMQLGAYVLGGSVGASPKGTEDGMARDLRLTAEGRAHRMLAGREDRYAVPCVHRDEVQALPDGAVLLAGNAHSPIQAFAYERDGASFWGVQYHPERTPEFIARGLARYRPGSEALQADLLAVGTDPKAAARLGTTGDAQEDAVRMTELRNWLAHVRGRSAVRRLQMRYPGAEGFVFGDNPVLCSELLGLVRAGKKRATCGAARHFELSGEALPEVGRKDIALNWDGTPALVIETVEVTRRRFDEVDEDFALAEGEDESLEGWQAGHRAYFERNGGWSPDMELVCERFEVVEDLAAKEDVTE